MVLIVNLSSQHGAFQRQQGGEMGGVPEDMGLPRKHKASLHTDEPHP